MDQKEKETIEIAMAHMNTVDELLSRLGGETPRMFKQLDEVFNTVTRQTAFLTLEERRALSANLWRGYLELYLKKPAHIG